MSIRHNSSQSQKTQAFRNVIRRGVYCQTQHNSDLLYVLCLELRPPKTTQMSAPPPLPPGEGTPGGPSPQFSCLQCRFLGPSQNLLLAPCVATLGLNTVKIGSKTTSF